MSEWHGGTLYLDRASASPVRRESETVGCELRRSRSSCNSPEILDSRSLHHCVGERHGDDTTTRINGERLQLGDFLPQR